MWAFGIIIILTTYICLLAFISRSIPNRLTRNTFKILAIIIPILYPFSYLVTPSYNQFSDLCNTNDRLSVFQTKKVNHLYLGDFAPYQASCNSAFMVLYQNKYQSVECKKVIKWVKQGNKAERGIYRYTRNKNWSSNLCGRTCLAENPFRENYCGNKCVDGALIDQPENYYYSKSNRTFIINNKLSRRVSELYDSKLGLMARQKNYTYYPYGNGWAKILGMSSALAPKKECEIRASINPYEIYIPAE